MKRKSITAILMSAVLISSISVSALIFKISAAEQNYKNITAHLSPQFNIVIDDLEQSFYNASGEQVYPIVYNGTTYLPLRAIGELMDKNVNWDQSSLTITLSGTRNGGITKGEQNSDVEEADITAQLRYDFTIIVDGIKRTFYDVNGNTVYPILYEGSTYLPLRAIGELMGNSVGWDEQTKTVSMNKNTDNLVTDADSFNQLHNQQNQNNYSDTETVSVEDAKNTAVNDAGILYADAKFVKAKMDYEDGIKVYDIEFYAGNIEYEYEINAVTGEIRAMDKEYINNTSSNNQYSGNEIISETEAKQIALNHAGILESNALFIKVKMDYEDGMRIYEVEFVVNNNEYEYEINAYTGEIIKNSFDLFN